MLWPPCVFHTFLYWYINQWQTLTENVVFSLFSVDSVGCWAHMICIYTYVRWLVAWSRTHCKFDTIPSYHNEVNVGMRDDGETLRLSWRNPQRSGFSSIPITEWEYTLKAKVNEWRDLRKASHHSEHRFDTMYTITESLFTWIQISIEGVSASQVIKFFTFDIGFHIIGKGIRVSTPWRHDLTLWNPKLSRNNDS